MQPEFVAVNLLPDDSFRSTNRATAGGSTLLNYHRGCHITLIANGHGQHFIGDSDNKRLML